MDDTYMTINTSVSLAEQAEVLLSNLVALSNSEHDNFMINHMDVLVTLKTAIKLLQEHQDDTSYTIQFALRN